MEYPFGHHHHHHHRRDDDEQERYPPPNYNPAPAPPPGPTTYPPIQHVSHEINSGFGYPPPSSYPPAVQHVSHDVNPGFPNQYGAAAPSYNYNPSPPPPVQHVSHEINDQGFQPQPSAEFDRPHHHRPHFPHSSFIHHHAHEGGAGSGLFNKPTVRVYTKAETNFSLTVRDGKVILSRSDPNDIYQHWIKDEKYSTRVKDEEGFPSFALVNKATGLAMKHSIGATHPVQLIPYNPDVLDESVLWAESRDLGDGYRTIRMVNNIRLNLDAFNGDKNHGGVHEGTIAVLWEWKKGDNQRWKIAPYCKSFEVSLSL